MNIKQRIDLWVRDMHTEVIPKDLVLKWIDEAATIIIDECIRNRGWQAFVYQGKDSPHNCETCNARHGCKKREVFGGGAGSAAPLHPMIGLIPKLSPEDAKRIREGSGRERGFQVEDKSSSGGRKALAREQNLSSPCPSKGLTILPSSTASQSQKPKKQMAEREFDPDEWGYG